MHMNDPLKDFKQQELLRKEVKNYLDSNSLSLRSFSKSVTVSIRPIADFVLRGSRISFETYLKIINWVLVLLKS